MTDVKSVIQIMFDCASCGCEHCDDEIEIDDNYFVNAINHYIQKHGYQIIHIGQHNVVNRNEQLNEMVAILGHKEILPTRELTKEEIEFNNFCFSM